MAVKTDRETGVLMQQKRAVQPVVWEPQYAPAPCKWWLEQPPRMAWLPWSWK